MAFSFGFYNAIDDDKMYDALDMSTIFDGIIEDGVYMNIGNALMVSANNGMIVNVGSGRAWFNHTWNYNDSEMPLMIPQSDLLLDRIDTIILDINSSEFSRTNAIKILQGTPSERPSGVSLIKTNEHWQYPLARILVKANSNDITQAEITNCVGTSECPFVKCPLESISTDTLIIQWESQFEAWFNRMKNQLSTDAAGNLQMQLDSVNDQLNGFSFGVTEDGKPGYKLEGADTVTPFKSNATIQYYPSLTSIDISSPEGTTNGNQVLHKVNGTFDLEGAIGIAFSVIGSFSDDTTYNRSMIMYVNGAPGYGKELTFSYTRSQIGALKWYYFFPNNPLETGDGSIYIRTYTVQHTTGYPHTNATLNINDFYIIH